MRGIAAVALACVVVAAGGCTKRIAYSTTESSVLGGTVYMLATSIQVRPAEAPEFEGAYLLPVTVVVTGEHDLRTVPLVIRAANHDDSGNWKDREVLDYLPSARPDTLTLHAALESGTAHLLSEGDRRALSSRRAARLKLDVVVPAGAPVSVEPGERLLLEVAFTGTPPGAGSEYEFVVRRENATASFVAGLGALLLLSVAASSL